MHKPLHPGEHIRDALIDGAGLSITEAARRLGLSRTSLSRILNGHTDISREMALRLSKLLDTSIEFWMNLQTQYDACTYKKAANWTDLILNFRGASEINSFELPRDELLSPPEDPLK